MEIQLWRELLDPYQLAVDELVVKFNHIRTEHIRKGQYPPIEQVEGRVKSIASILEKMRKKDISLNELDEKMEDIAGIRLTCQFIEDIDRLYEIIQQREDMEVKSVKDYVKNMKKSGYRSFHLIIYYTVQTLDGPRKLHVELQIRTMAMNFWAIIEHSLQYKYKGNLPETVQKKLMDCSLAIIEIDKEMSDVRDEILDAQNHYKEKENIIKDILNNIQDLFAVANKREVVKIQDEFYRVYMLDDMNQLRHFAKQLDIIAEGYRAQTY